MFEEGERELICYFCGYEFRARKYFKKHYEAHIDAECSGVEMPDDCWRGSAYKTTSDEEESDLKAVEAEKEKRTKKKKYVSSKLSSLISQCVGSWERQRRSRRGGGRKEVGATGPGAGRERAPECSDFSIKIR